MSFPPTRDPIEVNLWPGRVAQWSLSTQAGFTQNLLIKDADGNILVNASDSGTKYFAKTGTFMGGKNPHTVAISANGKPSDVQAASSAMVLGGKATSKTYLFASEDLGDGDYQDSFVTLTWFEFHG